MTKFQRKPRLTPSAILTSDWHLREDSPQCRTDNFWVAQEKKIDFIFDLARKNNCPIFCAGDIGHKPRWSCRLLEWFISKNVKDIEIFSIPGQHDLINHRLDLWEHSGVGVLHASESIILLTEPSLSIYPFPYSVSIKKVEDNKKYKWRVALAHQMVIQSQKDKLWETQETHSAKWFLKKFPCYDLIVTGDNHQSFAVEYEGRWLVNCGSIMRMTADQINHKPRVALWYADKNEIEWAYLPIEKNVISREHIEEKENRDERIEAYLEKLNTQYEVGLSFEKNLEEYFKKNKTKKGAERKVWKALS